MKERSGTAMKLEVLSCCLLAIFIDCSDNCTSVTETDSGVITGWVVDGDRQGIAGAAVTLRTIDLSGEAIAGGVLPQPGLARRTDLYIGVSAISTQTSPGGFFTFDSVLWGDYYLEVNSHDSSGAIVDVSIGKNAPIQSVDTVTAGKFGAIKGSIDLSLVKTDSTVIYVMKLDRSMRIDSSDVFYLDNVPASDYYLQLVDDSTLVPSLLDTVVVSVAGEDTAEVYGIGVEPGTLNMNGVIRE